jgi:TM2 domain-containing membrane protein YozV
MTAMTPSVRHGFDPDFAAEVLEDLYAYRRKRTGMAFGFWITLGWLGAHRFYLLRPATGLLMLLTGGGGLIWWIVDAWRIPRMVRAYNDEQDRREREGQAPVELAFMPPVASDVLREPPPWTLRWHERGRTWRALRLGGDLLVLLVAGAALGALVGVEGGAEATLAVVALIAVTLLGGAAPWLDRLPLLRSLVRWSHRLRLFYYYNKPGPPPALLVRGATAILLAPFRRRDRAEVRIYLELGAAFTVAFMALDLVEDVAVPLAGVGLAALGPVRLAGVWIEEAFMTFLVTYAFAAPVGAVLTFYLLTRPTHTLPRLLGAFALFAIALGAGLI